ncbi:MAG: DUF4350 domain-containing protein [Acidobacteriota bacterium]
MKQKLLIFVVFAFLLLILIGLNAATYVQKEKTPDNEFSPNRSTFNSGTTGSQAYYALLSETGRNVTRWQVPVAELPAAGRSKPDVFVLIAPRLDLTDVDQSNILKWVADGGRLILIDREPPPKLLVSDPWSLTVEKTNDPGILAIDPSDVGQMTSGVTAAKAVQPTAFTISLNAVQPSRLASSIGFERKSYGPQTITGSGSSGGDEVDDSYEADEPPPPPKPAPTTASANSDRKVTVNGPPAIVPSPAVGGPVIHVAAGDKNIVVDVPYGAGRIVVVSDPYIVSNAGIGLVDNATLALNLVSSGTGAIAFDEYHQGYGTNNNQLVRYFQGTPVIAIFLQLAALVALVLFSQSRRFARALPEDEPDRLSKLEYISAMAELQQRTSAYDLAVENIYNDFRRRVSRLVGADNTTVKRTELAKLVAERAKMPAAEVEELMFKCEDIMHGEPTGRKETLELIKQLRAVEARLGMSRVARAKI